MKWKAAKWNRSHQEIRSVINLENSIFDELEDVEVKKGEVRRRFEIWAKENSPEVHNLALLLQDNFKDQRDVYQQYFKKYSEFINSVSKALEQEKFLDPIESEVKRYQKKADKADRKFLKTRTKYDTAMTKRNWSMKERKYNRKLDLAGIKKAESERLRDTSQSTYDTEQKRINDNIRKYILEGYMTLVKENYVLQRSEIMHHERVFDQLREFFPNESREMDLPREKLTPILQMNKDQQDQLKREQYDREKAKQPKMSIQQAMEAALPQYGKSGGEHGRGGEAGVGRGEQGVSGGEGRQWQKQPSDINAPEAPPLPRQEQMVESQKHHTGMSGQPRSTYE